MHLHIPRSICVHIKVHTSKNFFCISFFRWWLFTASFLVVIQLTNAIQPSWRCFFFFGPFPEVSLNRRPRYLTDERILVSEALIITTLLRNPDNRLRYWSGDLQESWRRRKRNSLVSRLTINASVIMICSFSDDSPVSPLVWSVSSFVTVMIDLVWFVEFQNVCTFIWWPWSIQVFVDRIIRNGESIQSLIVVALLLWILMLV